MLRVCVCAVSVCCECVCAVSVCVCAVSVCMCDSVCDLVKSSQVTDYLFRT